MDPFGNQKSEIRNPNGPSGNQKSEIRNQESEIRNPVEIRNPTEIRNPREIRNPPEMKNATTANRNYKLRVSIQFRLAMTAFSRYCYSSRKEHERYVRKHNVMVLLHNAVYSVTSGSHRTRRLQGIHYFTTRGSNSLFALPLLVFLVLIERWSRSHPCVILSTVFAFRELTFFITPSILSLLEGIGQDDSKAFTALQQETRIHSLLYHF